MMNNRGGVFHLMKRALNCHRSNDNLNFPHLLLGFPGLFCGLTTSVILRNASLMADKRDLHHSFAALSFAAVMRSANR